MPAQEETKPTEEAPSTTSPSTATESTEGKPATYTEMASNAAAGAGTAAIGAKDSIFGMFGGGAKKEKTEEPEGEVDRSGSSKAKKDAEAAEKEEDAEGVCSPLFFTHHTLSLQESYGNARVWYLNCVVLYRKTLPTPPKSISSP